MRLDLYIPGMLEAQKRASADFLDAAIRRAEALVKEAQDYTGALEVLRSYVEGPLPSPGPLVLFLNYALTCNNRASIRWAAQKLREDWAGHPQAIHGLCSVLDYEHNYGGDPKVLQEEMNTLLQLAAQIDDPRAEGPRTRWLLNQALLGNFGEGSLARNIFNRLDAYPVLQLLPQIQLGSVVATSVSFDLGVFFLQKLASRTKATTPLLEIEALTLERNGGNCLSLLPQLAQMQLPQEVTHALQILQHLGAPLPATQGNEVTTVIITNLSNKLIDNHEIAPPKIDLIANSWHSYREKLNVPPEWPVRIYYDYPATPSAEADEYKANLEKFAAEIGATLTVLPHYRLPRVYSQLLQDVTTPFLFFLEHDWTFYDTAIPLRTLADTMERHPFVHALRVCKQYLIQNGWDKILMAEPNVKDAPLLKTMTFCNNPCLLRVDKLRRDYAPLWSDGVGDDQNSGGGTNEIKVSGLLEYLASVMGPTLAHRAAGLYFYGIPGNAPMTRHTGH